MIGSKRRYGTSRRRSGGGFMTKLLIFLLIAAGIGYYVYTSEKFEREAPVVKLPDVVYAGSNRPLNVTISDNVALSGYNAYFTNGDKMITAASGLFDMPMKNSEIIIPFIDAVKDAKESEKWKLIITAKDKSFWNYLQGNDVTATVDIVSDTKPPLIEVVSKSQTLARGGSGLIVYRATDSGNVDTYIVSNGIKFKVKPYKKSGYYAGLFAWPFKKKNMDVRIVAIDGAGNQSEHSVKFPPIRRKYKVSTIRLSDRFIDGKIVEVASLDPKASKVKGRLNKFKAVNEGMRIGNENLIHKYSKVFDDKTKLKEWKIKPFYPMRGAKLVADFGGKRHYYYKSPKKVVSNSYHVGYDLASVAQAPIKTSNDGKVVYSDYNGIYGNMPLIDHGFGLYTLYGHSSELMNEVGDRVTAGQVIAKSGKTGLAMGDHTHFGVLIQGVEVWPMEWMKKNWIKTHIDDVFKRADKVMGISIVETKTKTKAKSKK